MEANSRKGAWLSGLALAGWGLLLLAAVNLFVGWYSGSERVIRYWDLGGYWGLWMEFGEQTVSYPRGALVELFRSLNAMDVSCLGVAPLSFWYRWLGPEFQTYVCALLNVYLFPFFVLFLAGVLVVVWRRRVPLWSLMVWMTAVVGFVPLYQPLLLGYPDVMGLLVVTTVLLLCSDEWYLRIEPGRALVLGWLLLLMVLIRRWYMFWAFGFLLALALVALAELRRGRAGWKPLAACAANLALAGVTILLTVQAFLSPLIWQRVGVDYRDYYTAYRVGPVITQLRGLWDHFGAFWSLAALGGITVVLTGCGARLRRFGVLTALSAILATAAFLQIQTFSSHHRYLLAANLLVLLSLGWFWFVERVKTFALRAVAAAVVVLVTAANWISVWTPGGASAVPGFLKPWLSSEHSPPLVRNDWSELRGMVSEIRQLTAGRDPWRPVYVLASSQVLNADVLDRLEWPWVPRSVPNMIRPCAVDKIEGFPQDFFLAHYVLVGKPIQLHLAPREQRVVSVLAESLLDSAGLGRNYRRIASYRLDRGVEAILYEKTGPCDRATLDRLRTVYCSAYPRHLNLNRISGVLPLAVASGLGDECGDIHAVGATDLFMHPGAHTATWIQMAVKGHYRFFRARATFDNLAVLRDRPQEQGEVRLRVEADGRIIRDIEVSARQEPVALDVDLQGVRQLKVTVDNGKFGPAADWFVLRDLQVERDP